MFNLLVQLTFFPVEFQPIILRGFGQLSDQGFLATQRFLETGDFVVQPSRMVVRCREIARLTFYRSFDDGRQHRRFRQLRNDLVRGSAMRLQRFRHGHSQRGKWFAELVRQALLRRILFHLSDGYRAHAGGGGGDGGRVRVQRCFYSREACYFAKNAALIYLLFVEEYRSSILNCASLFVSRDPYPTGQYSPIGSVGYVRDSQCESRS